MKLGIISFTERGTRLNEAVTMALTMQGYDCENTAMPKYAVKYGIKELDMPLKQWTGEMFARMDAILFIGAAGIAVRSIAPFLEHKSKDPAVVVMDEKGIFAISLVSGHLGGANELAAVLANLTGAIPVITTATDVNGRFAVDIFAKKNGLHITNMKYAKEISADVLDEKKIGFFSDFPVISDVPEELEIWNSEEVFEGVNGICVTLDEGKMPYKQTLCLIPEIVSIGVGCKKDTDSEIIREKVEAVLKDCRISRNSIEKIASIDLKKEEAGLIALAESYGVPFVTFAAQQLKEAPGSYTPSPFVESITGVDNVCERSAVLASQGGKLIKKKTAGDGVTVALAVKDWSVDFG
ncbi:MAG: cobalt-precorrin 5A hydrolase [Eubacteriales bacterium]|nr:cobalt-precorrin 5A hydrolase [Eubacteriales bacterium]